MEGSTSPRIGEVIEASTNGFTAQCYELYQLPPLGSPVLKGFGEVAVDVSRDRKGEYQTQVIPRSQRYEPEI